MSQSVIGLVVQPGLFLVQLRLDGASQACFVPGLLAGLSRRFVGLVWSIKASFPSSARHVKGWVFWA